MKKLAWSFSSIPESLRQTSLIAIFVTIINRAKDKSPASRHCAIYRPNLCLASVLRCQSSFRR
jgi:hypothetical protein